MRGGGKRANGGASGRGGAPVLGGGGGRPVNTIQDKTKNLRTENLSLFFYSLLIKIFIL